MINPPPSPNPGSYVDLQKRMTQALRASLAAEQMLETCQRVYEKELEKQNLVLSRLERTRLFRQAMKTILTEMLQKFDET